MDPSVAMGSLSQVYNTVNYNIFNIYRKEISLKMVLFVKLTKKLR